MASASFTPGTSSDYGSIESPANFYPGEPYLSLGKSDGYCSSFTRFVVSIPHGATIDTCKLRITSLDSVSGGTVNLRVYFNRADDAAVPADYSGYEALLLTDAVSWPGLPAWTEGLVYESPELKTILQGIVTRSGYVAGNAVMALIHEAGETSDTLRFGDAATVELYVEWTENAIVSIRSNQNMTLSMGEPFFSRSAIVAPYGDAIAQTLITSFGIDGPALSVPAPLGTGCDWKIFSGLGDGSAHAIMAGFPVSVLQSVSNRVGWWLYAYQGLLNQLSRGDHAQAIQAAAVPLPDEARGIQTVISSLSEQVAGVQGLLNQLSRGDHAQAIQAGIAPLPDNIVTRHQIINSLSESVFALQRQVLTLSGDPVAIYRQLLQSIAANNDIHAMQQIGLSLDDPIGRYFSTAAEIYLDGRPLRSRMITAEILFDENSVHNSLTITSADPELFDWADPMAMPGHPRIEAHVGARLMYFIIDTRPGERSGFTVNCLSVSALEDGPYAPGIDFQLSQPETASSIADSLTNYCPVDWQAPDWVVPVEFAFSGYALDGVQALAAEIDAVVRCQDDGSLLVRKRRPVRPIHMDGATAAVDYDRSLLISLSQSEEAASGHNAVEVSGRADDVYVPQIMLEDVTDGPYIGQTVYLRVYWAGRPVSVIDTYVTDGILKLIGSGAFFEQTEEELVEFKSGAASLPLPIFDLVSWEWIGDAAGPISYEQYGTDLVIADNAFRAAKVKYRSRYQKYSVSGHHVERLIAVLFLNPGSEIVARVRTADEPVWGPPVSAPLLTDARSAVERASAWIDAVKYRKSVISVETPYSDAATDGVLAYINDDQIGYPGNHHITSSKIVIDGPKITNVLGMEKCLV